MGLLGGRREWTVPLLGATLAFCLAGVFAAHLSGVTITLDRYFPQGPWRWTLYSCGALGIAALLLTFAESFQGGYRTEHIVNYDGSRSAAVDATILEVHARVNQALEGRSPDVARALDESLRGAMVLGASDIHLTPLEDRARVTFRVDGSLVEAFTLPPDQARRFVLRAKVLANLESYDLRPQDGTFVRQLGTRAVQARVSALPSNHGERLVLRLVRSSDAAQSLAELGFDPRVERGLRAVLEKTQGVFYVSGPVGSGKTTTLYSALQELHRLRGETTALVSLEDPIEHQLPFVTQTQINEKTGFGFARALRSVLRQDPGALMIGEVRDSETAEIATQAGLTGHLILTTIHVQSAASTFARLLDMGIKPVLVADACAGALAQRLVRRLCPECRTWDAPSPQQRERLEHLGVAQLTSRYATSLGCAACEGRGFAGRRLIAEILTMTPAIRRAITDGASASTVHALAVEEGLVPLIDSAMALAERGETSLDEVLRVTS